jgi:PAS domain-containing protein
MGEECLGALTSILEENEQWLMRRVLSYAQRLAYTRYTSTLEEAWRVSIQGLSRSLLAAVERGGWDLEIPVDCDLGCDGAASFGIEEARLHRSRGVTLAMFLGLMKYYRQAYLDLLGDQNLDPSVRRLFSHAVHRFFDRVEIGFCDEWQSPTDGEHVRVLEERNRRMTNEKNKYLTVFDSLRTPVLLFDSQGRIDNANALAAQLFGLSDHSGAAYYSGEGRGRVFQPLAGMSRPSPRVTLPRLTSNGRWRPRKGPGTSSSASSACSTCRTSSPASPPF